MKNNLLNDIKKRDIHSELKRAIGTVVSVNEINSFATVVLDNSNAHIVLLNKTGEILSVGDNVWIHYWDSISDGCIVLKCGSNGDRKYFMSNIDNAFLLTEESHSYVTTHTYSTEDVTGSNRNIKPSSLGSISRDHPVDLRHYDHDGNLVNDYICTAQCGFDGGAVTFHWVTNANWYSRITDSNDILNVYTQLSIPQYTEIYLGGGNYEYYLEYRSFSIHQWYDDDTGRYYTGVLKSQTEHEEKQFVPCFWSSVEFPDINDYGIILYLGDEHPRISPLFTHYDKNMAIMYSSELDKLVYAGGIYAVRKDSNGHWYFANKAVYQSYYAGMLIIPARDTLLTSSTYSCNVTETKERSEVI